MDGTAAGARHAHGGRPGHRLAAEWHRFLRLHQPDRHRRHAHAAALDRTDIDRRVRAAVRRRTVSGIVLVKMVGLAIIFVYAFFKFAWSYRLFNYFAIMVVAAPPPEQKDTAAAQAFAHRAARLCADAGRHFNRGQRAFFFALGYLGWFLGPLPLALTTTGIVIVMWRRQFASDARLAVSQTPPPGPGMN